MIIRPKVLNRIIYYTLQAALTTSTVHYLLEQ